MPARNGHGVFGSTDGGHSWRPLGPSGCRLRASARNLAGRPRRCLRRRLGLDARGLYKSTRRRQQLAAPHRRARHRRRRDRARPREPNDRLRRHGGRAGRRLQEHRRRRHLAAGELGPAAAAGEGHTPASGSRSPSASPLSRSIPHTPRRCTRPPVRAASSEARTRVRAGTPFNAGLTDHDVTGSRARCHRPNALRRHRRRRRRQPPPATVKVDRRPARPVGHRPGASRQVTNRLVLPSSAFDYSSVTRISRL